MKCALWPRSVASFSLSVSQSVCIFVCVPFVGCPCFSHTYRTLRCHKPQSAADLKADGDAQSPDVRPCALRCAFLSLPVLLSVKCPFEYLPPCVSVSVRLIWYRFCLSFCQPSFSTWTGPRSRTTSLPPNRSFCVPFFLTILAKLFQIPRNSFLCAGANPRRLANFRGQTTGVSCLFASASARHFHCVPVSVGLPLSL